MEIANESLWSKDHTRLHLFRELEHLTRELCSGTNDGPNIRNEIRTLY
jgi:hypothetical protein